MKTNQTKSIGPSLFSVRGWMLNVAVLATAVSALADVHYVDVNSTNATPPYTNWSTAATNIQDAVDVAVAGDEIVVTNGYYDPVAVNKPLSVRSVNGPQLTVINGGGHSRCASLPGGASLSGFTLINGFTFAHYDGTGGGGVWCASKTAGGSNCLIAGNRIFTDYPSYSAGGAAYGGGFE